MWLYFIMFHCNNPTSEKEAHLAYQMFTQSFKHNTSLILFFLSSSFLGNGLLPPAPLGILWEFLSCLASQLLFFCFFCLAVYIVVSELVGGTPK